MVLVGNITYMSSSVSYKTPCIYSNAIFHWTSIARLTKHSWEETVRMSI